MEPIIGSAERVQGGYVSNMINDDSSITSLELSPKLALVEVLDYTQTNHINLEAGIPLEPPEQAGRPLYQWLGITGMREKLIQRVRDLKKNLAASQRNLGLLRKQVEVKSQN